MPLSTCTMPVGHRNTAISNGHDDRGPRAPAPSPVRGARPGCTRYQWPSSIASLTRRGTRRRRARRARREQVRAARELAPPRAGRARRAIGAIEVERGRELRRRRVGASSSSPRGRSSPRPARRRSARTSSRPRTPARAGAAPTPTSATRGRDHARDRGDERDDRAAAVSRRVSEQRGRARPPSRRTRCGSASRSRG